MEAAYAVAGELLSRGWAKLGRTAPDRIPLRLRGEDGLLLSALARSAGAEGGALAQRLVGTLVLEGTPFDRVEAREGLLLLRFSQRWLKQVLECYGALPWPEPVGTRGLRRQDRGDPAFVRDYTLRRCRTLTERGGEAEAEAMPKGLICLLAQGPGVRGTDWADEIVRRYWALSPALRRTPLLAGAVGRTAGIWNLSEAGLQKIHLSPP